MRERGQHPNQLDPAVLSETAYGQFDFGWPSARAMHPLWMWTRQAWVSVAGLVMGVLRHAHRTLPCRKRPEG